MICPYWPSMTSRSFTLDQDRGKILSSPAGCLAKAGQADAQTNRITSEISGADAS